MVRLLPGTIVHDEWEVPAFDIAEFRQKTTNCCTVIPVLNEGNRLLDQLTQMRNVGCMKLSDVIVIDGGSDDGSTDLDALSAFNLRAVLFKRGKGKLSAQLRVAYAWALEQGYLGIVTIDGNGKDSVDSLPTLVDALNRGFDYVQGSRFVPGGAGINTPLARTLAIRLIHSPILSLAAGHWFTDTTQGYRGYSARYLLHPNVQPFRAVFSTYELLSYLTVRASQLGLAVTEVPTRRAYPPNGLVPTKITLIKGSLNLLKILWSTLIRRYHPRS